MRNDTAEPKAKHAELPCRPSSEQQPHQSQTPQLLPSCTHDPTIPLLPTLLCALTFCKMLLGPRAPLPKILQPSRPALVLAHRCARTASSCRQRLLDASAAAQDGGSASSTNGCSLYVLRYTEPSTWPGTWPTDNQRQLTTEVDIGAVEERDRGVGTSPLKS